MMDKVLTVIVPTFNMEEYLVQCLDSLLIESNLEYLEVLIINDGSKDRSSQIAHHYADVYPSVFRVIDKENGNYGSCINRGLQEASGKYVKVLDADDSFDTRNFDRFLSFLSEEDVDLVFSDFVTVNPKGEITGTPHCEVLLDKKSSFPLDQIISSSFNQWIEMHAVTYRRSVLTDMNYKQREGISYTDQQWIFTPMIGVKTAIYFNKPVYRYLLGREGQTMNPAVLQKQSNQLCLCIYSILEDFVHYRHRVSSNRLPYLLGRMSVLIRGIYVNNFCNFSAEKKRDLLVFDKKIKTLCEDVYNYIAYPVCIKGMKFSYISFWRRHPNLPVCIVKLVSRCFIHK